MHEDARANPLETVRHEGFIGFRLLTSFAALALVPHEWVALTGRSGTGKSTLLRVIAGITQLDEVNSFYNPAFFHIEAGNDALG